MSGGVDSSVAAYLAKQQGYECIGITMKLFNSEDIAIANLNRRSCCSLDDINDARNAANLMGIPFYVNNFSSDFKEKVIEPFIKAYEKGETPNPCIDCNRYVKFEKLLFRARQLGIDYLVTGHYARIVQDEKSGRRLIKKAADIAKDQSYVLYAMTQEQLSSTLFPLGELSKDEVRKIAKEQGFNNADKEESQDICFVPDGNYAKFIEEYSGISCEEGNFVDIAGKVLGRHRGIIRYTIGQRRGLAVSLNRPMYVHSINIKDNTVVLCEDEDLFSRNLYVRDFNWIACEKPEGEIRCKVKIRYNQSEQWAIASVRQDDTVHICFDEPQRAITSGQAAVLYSEDTVLGGGTIV